MNQINDFPEGEYGSRFKSSRISCSVWKTSHGKGDNYYNKIEWIT